MKRWQQLEPRQQAISAIVIACVLAAATVTLSVALHGHERELRRQLVQQRADAAELQRLAALYDASRGTPSAKSAADADLAALVSGSLQSAGLQPTRLQQDGVEMLQVRLDAAPYAEVITWLAQLEQQPAVAVVRLTLTQGPNGTVAVALSLRKRT